MAESQDVDGPILLKTFNLDAQEWIRVMYPYKLVNAIFRLTLALTAGTTLLCLLYSEMAMYFIGGAMGLLMMVLLARYTNMKGLIKDPLNRAAWQNRQIEFDDHEIRIAGADGTRSQIPVRNLVLCTDVGAYYLLHITRSHSFVVPKTAFQSPKDEAEFRKVLFRNKLIPSLIKK
jgi:hypothetical protein